MATKQWMHASISSTQIHRRNRCPSVPEFAADHDSRFMVERSLFRLLFFRWQSTHHWTIPFGEFEIASLSIAVSQSVQTRQSRFLCLFLVAVQLLHIVQVGRY